jgi:hypothetical protein
MRLCAPGALPRPLSCVRSAGGRIHYTHTHNSDAARDSIPRGCASAAERDVRACAPGRDSAGRADHRRCAVQRSSHYNCGAGGSAAQRRRSTGRGSAHHADARARAQAEAQRITRTRRRKRSAITAAAQAALRRGPGESGLNAHEIGRTSVFIFFYSELAAATAEFADSNRIGGGGFGSLFFAVPLRVGQRWTSRRLTSRACRERRSS